MKKPYHQLANRTSHLQPEGAYAFLAKAQQLEAKGREIIHLEIGQPDFPTPEHIVEAAHRAARDGFTGYTSNAGIPGRTPASTVGG